MILSGESALKNEAKDRGVLGKLFHKELSKKTGFSFNKLLENMYDN